MRLPNRTWLACLCWLLAAACGPAPSEQPRPLAYRFADGGRYRVEAEYTLERKLEKAHRGQVFSSETSRLDIHATFLLRVLPGPEPGQLQLEFMLVRLRSHDPLGKFRAELGQESGELVWYGDTLSLEKYLGPEGWLRYAQVIRQPLARLVILPLGSEAPAEGQGGGFNQELVRLLLTNRVLGERLIRGLKIPPVMAVILPPRPVGVGESWSAAAPERAAASEWDQPAATRFTLASSRRGALVVKLENRLAFSGEDLTALGSLVGLKHLGGARFEGGQFLIAGDVRFLAGPGRPQDGRLRVEKRYGLKNNDEDWRLRETEEYEFALTPDP